MDIREKIGQRLVFGFPGTTIPAEFAALVREYKIGNVILFRYNIESPPQLARLCADIQELIRGATGRDAFITIDQEGGMVTRLSWDAVNVPGSMALAATGKPENAVLAAEITARQLRGVGVINIARMYGVGAVAHKANVDIQITLEEFDPRANYDRVAIEEKKMVSILDVDVPKITIPVREGRSMGVIIESAVTNYMLAKDGLDSAKEFEQRVLEFIEKNKEESDAAVS